MIKRNNSWQTNVSNQIKKTYGGNLHHRSIRVEIMIRKRMIHGVGGRGMIYISIRGWVASHLQRLLLDSFPYIIPGWRGIIRPSYRRIHGLGSSIEVERTAGILIISIVLYSSFLDHSPYTVFLFLINGSKDLNITLSHVFVIIIEALQRLLVTNKGHKSFSYSSRETMKNYTRRTISLV